MTYIGSHNNQLIGVSTHQFTESHRIAILQIADGNNTLRNLFAIELENMGLARVAHQFDHGATVLTSRGDAMVAYLKDRGEDWR